MAKTNPLAILRANQRVWVIGAIHSQVDQLREIHAQIANDVQHGDRLIYTGNMIGYGDHTHETLNEILAFRRWFLSIWPMMKAEDVVYLRGRQEEMLWKTTQLHFAPNPQQVIDYIYKMGLAPVLESYGLRKEQFEAAAAQEVTAMVTLTSRLSNALRNQPGHDPLLVSLKQAAYSEDGLLLFVSSGLDASRTLQDQQDCFWWDGAKFEQNARGFGSYCRIIRGYDPLHGGYKETPFTVTMDGEDPVETAKVHAVCLDRQGEVIKHLTSDI